MGALRGKILLFAFNMLLVCRWVFKTNISTSATCIHRKASDVLSIETMHSEAQLDLRAGSLDGKARIEAKNEDFHIHLPIYMQMRKMISVYCSRGLLAMENCNHEMRMPDIIPEIHLNAQRRSMHKSRRLNASFKLLTNKLKCFL